MITKDNYYSLLADMDQSKFDAELKKGALLVDEATDKGKDWTLYETDKDIKRVINLYFSDLSQLISEKKKVQKPKESPSEIVDNYGKSESIEKQKTASRRKAAPKLKVVKRVAEGVERISEELKLIKRYTLLNGKVKTRDQIRLFLNALQRAITEKRIRKTSPHAKEIDYIQDSLLSLYGKFGRKESLEVTIEPSRLSKLLALAGKEAVLKSVTFIKSYISLQGKRISNQQATRLYNRITKAVDNDLVPENDLYRAQVEEIALSLQSFVKKNPGEGILVIPFKELNGLQGIVGIDGLTGIETAPKHVRMNSMDFVQLEFEKLGFKDKWLEFFGDPSPGFTVLVTGPAKHGKSMLCTDFAGYLARQHGSVLYVAKEEGLDDTLKRKLIEVAHPNLTVQDYFDGDVRGFDFVFLDSITRLNLGPEDLNKLKEDNPHVSFIFISQVTKAGKARGSNEFYHDVDSIVEFLDFGYAVQHGRFNQGGHIRLT